MPESANPPETGVRICRHIGIPDENRRNLDEGNSLRFPITSEEEVKRWEWREVLSHDPAHIRLDRLRSVGAVLINHDPDKRVGAVAGADIQNKRLYADINFLTNAAGQDAKLEVKEGSLRGVSCWYIVHKWELDEENMIARAVDWEPLEATLTPIPADISVGTERSHGMTENQWLDALGMRSQPETPAHQSPAADNQRHTPEKSAMSDPVTPAAGQETEAPTAEGKRTAQPGGGTSTPAAGIDHLRVSQYAEQMGLQVSDYLRCTTTEEAVDKIFADHARRSAPPVPGAEVPGARTQITSDEADKQADALVRGISAHDIARRCGMDPTLSKRDASDWILDNMGIGKRAVEDTSGFSLVAGLAAEKATIDAFENYDSMYQLIADETTANDFKSISTAGLQHADFATQASEGDALAAATLGQAGGTGALTIRGNTLHLSRQLIENDDLGLFFRQLARLGAVAARHIDISVLAALAGADFTNATAALDFNTANLKTAWTNFMGVTGPGGVKPGYAPSRLLLPSALYIEGSENVTMAQGETTARILAQGENALTPVHGKFLSDANDWYLLADPAEAAAVTVVRHAENMVPRVTEIDSGAVPGRKVRVEFPLATIVNNMDVANTRTPVGAYKATSA